MSNLPLTLTPSLLGEIPFKIRTIALTQPAAGADFAAISVPDFAFWVLLSVGATLVSGVGVANRFVRLAIYSEDGTTTLSEIQAAYLQVASETMIYRWVQGAQFSGRVASAGITNERHTAPLPNFPIPTGMLIQIRALNIAAADQFSSGNMVVAEFLAHLPLVRAATAKITQIIPTGLT